MTLPTRKTPVCLVERNPLAACQLNLLLRRNSALKTIPEEEIFAFRGTACLEGFIFVLDCGTLPFSLGKFAATVESRFPAASMLVLNEQWTDDDICRLLFRGIQGFLCYSEVTDNLLRAIHVISQGRMWVKPEALEHYVRYSRRLPQSEKGAGASLTQREQRILELVQRHLSNKEISTFLGVAPATVKFHLSNIFSKLGVHDRHLLGQQTVTLEVGGAFQQETRM